MADYSPYVPGYMAARSVWDQGIAPLAGKVQGFLKGTAGLPGTVKDYAMETLQSELGPTTQVGVDAFKLGHGMREGIREDPLRAIAEMYPPVGAASDLFETNQLLDMAQNAEEAGDLEKAQTLRELSNTIVLMGIVPGGPPAKRTIDQKLKEMEEKRRKLKEETGLPYVPNKDAPLPEGRRGDPYDPELDVLERQKRIEEATGAAPIETIACGDCYRWAYREVAKDPNLTLVHGTATDFDGKPFAHAWVESGDRVMDWQTMEQGMSKFGKEGGWPKDVFYDFYKPKNIQRYTSDQAVRIGPRNKHFGPWAKGGIVTL